MDNSYDKNWCLERLMVSGGSGEGSPLKMRPCETGRIKQMWVYDKQEKVIMSEKNANGEGFCIVRDGKQLVSKQCSTGGGLGVNTTISDGALNLIQNDPKTGWINMETANNKFYFAIDPIRIFSRVKLLRSGTENSSYDKWQLRYHGPSEFPSSIPSPIPSNKPSTWPSMDPSSNPSKMPRSQSSKILKWVPVYTKGTLSEPYAEKNLFDAIWAQSPNQILRRKCLDCTLTHQDIYYRRFDTNGLPSGFDLLNLVLENWFSDSKINHNTFDVNFKLYSTYDDALTDNNEWKFCNFDDAGIGFPRDCGPLFNVSSQWNSLNRGGKSNIGFYVEGLDEIPSSDPRSTTMTYLNNVGANPTELLDVCSGDCNTDSDCKDDLVCFQILVAGSPVPGCIGDVHLDWDYCADPTTEDYRLALKNSEGWDPTGPLGICTGDCDYDSDCESGLVCFHRNVDGELSVPGCSVTVHSVYDYCVDPALM
jgi:hypothetical protein